MEQILSWLPAAVRILFSAACGLPFLPDGGRGRVSASGGAVRLRTADLDTVGHCGNPCFAASADLRNAEKDTFSHGKSEKYDFRCEKASHFQQIACYFFNF